MKKQKVVKKNYNICDNEGNVLYMLRLDEPKKYTKGIKALVHKLNPEIGDNYKIEEVL